MGERDDLVDALLLDLFDRAGDRRHVLADQNVRPDRGELGRVICDRADDADLFAADIRNDRRLDPIADLRFVTRQDIGGDDGER